MGTKIVFRHGAMNSGKSLELIKVAYNYNENGIKTLIIKPQIDSKLKNKIISRAGLQMDAIEIDENDVLSIEKILKKSSEKIILVEESNFLSKEVIDKIIDTAYDNNIDSVMFFGLKVDFSGVLFEGSKRLIERADKIEESTSICWCGKKARQNGRSVNGKLIKEGPTILIDIPENEVNYVMLCNYHYYKGDLGK